MTAAISPSIDHLELIWRSIDDLCSSLPEAEWKRPTGCPGWTVQDNLSHLIDYEATALGWPRPEHAPGALAHTKNALGESNELGVDFRRAWEGPRVLEEFRAVTTARLAQLRELTEEDLARPVTTPAGPGTLAEMLTLRVMDSWSHEQDMRRALGRPGHEDGPAAAEAVAHFAGFLPFVVGKRAAAPDGTTVLIRVGDLRRCAIAVSGGRANEVVEAEVEGEVDRPTVTLTLAPATFVALVGGRSDAPDNAVIDGDVALGRTILANLAIMP